MSKDEKLPTNTKPTLPQAEPPLEPMPGAEPASPFVEYTIRRVLRQDRFRRGSRRSIGDR